MASSSSQEKTCADDSQSRTEGQCSTWDQPNSDDVVDLSNDSFPSSTNSYLPTSAKGGVSSTETFDKTKQDKGQNKTKKGKNVPISKRTTRKTVEAGHCSNETSLTGLVGKQRRSGSRINKSPLVKLHNVFQLKPSKSYGPTKQATNLANFTEKGKWIVRARKMEECEYLSLAGFN